MYSKQQYWPLSYTNSTNGIDTSHVSTFQNISINLSSWGKKQGKTLLITFMIFIFIVISKTVQRVSPIHQEGNEPCFIHTIQYYCTTFTSRVNVKRKYCQNRMYPNDSKFYNLVLYLLLNSGVFMKTWILLYTGILPETTE